VGAELRNLVNEAALLAARRDASVVGAEDFAEALQKVTLGPALAQALLIAESLNAKEIVDATGLRDVRDRAVAPGAQ
jgi:ATP-dependent Zn protease